MEINARKKYTIEEMEDMIERFQEEYGSIHRLKRKAVESGCADPQAIDDLMIWLTLIKNRQNIRIPQDLLSIETTFELDFIEHASHSGFGMAKFLTPKRLELLAEIKENPGRSIKEIAQQLDRDYKNVYDDIQALARFDLLKLIKEGKARIPSLPIDNISITI